MACDLSQSDAQVLFREGAMFVFLDVPEKTEFGIDYNSWETGPKFKGVKMIPPGIHFIYYSATNKEGQVAPRTGFFYNFKQREMVVRKWDKKNEDMQVDDVSADEIQRLESNRKELDQFLGAYPYDSYKKWVSLTNQITESLMLQLQPSNGKISSVTQLVSTPSNSKSRLEHLQSHGNSSSPREGQSSLKSAEANLPQMEVKKETEIKFSEVPSRKFPIGATPAEITKYSMDTSYALQTMLDTHYQDNKLQILGEMQFAFVCFLIGQVYDAFEQWKKLVQLLCTSEEAVVKHPDLYTQLIRTLHFQVGEIPEDFFVDIVSNNNFLTSTLKILFTNFLENTDVCSDLKKRGLKFRDSLTKRFKWDFTQELDEDAPVIVE